MGLDNLTSFIYHADSFYVFFPVESPQMIGAALAYYVEISKPDSTIDTIGRVDGDVLRLQLLKPGFLRSDGPFWDAEWKNVYFLEQRDIDYDILNLDVYRGETGTGRENASGDLNHQAGVPYLQLLGLDQENQTGQLQPDGKIDQNEAILDRECGLLIFPDRRPFDPPADVRHSVEFPDAVLEDRVPEVYETTNVKDLVGASTYYIRSTIPVAPSRTISLGAGEVVPGSEIVTLNGQKLIRGAQYTVEYSKGTVTLHDNVPVNSSSDLSICFDYFAKAASATSW